MYVKLFLALALCLCGYMQTDYVTDVWDILLTIGVFALMANVAGVRP